MSQSTPNACPTDDALVAYVEGGESTSAIAGLDEHIASCGRCQDALRLFAAVTAAPDPSRSPGLPRVPGRYRLQRSLGRGGQGVVWRARDTVLDRDVALKLVHCPDAEHRERLQAEARALARLEHPHVLEVFDIDLSGDPGFIAMPVCHGTLADEVGREVGWRAVIDTMRDVAAGLAAVHRAGLVHRDIKPANVLRDEAGGVKIGDFGIVSTPGLGEGRSSSDGAGSGSESTLTGLYGTPAYLAPELQAGARHDAASDQYAFFVSLVQLLDGELPRRGERWSASPRIPRWLERVVNRGLAPDPRDRHSSLDAVGQALRGPRRWRSAIPVVAGVGVLSFVMMSSSSPSPSPPAPPPACVGLQARTWSPAMRSAVEVSGHRRAAERIGTLAEHVQTFATELSGASSEFCEARRHEALRCLVRVQERVDAMTGRLAAGDVTPEGVDTVNRLMPELASLEHCARIEERVGAGPESDPEARAAAVAVVHGAYADEVLGADREAAQARLGNALAQGQLEPYPDLHATALRRSASHGLRRSDRDPAEIDAQLSAAERLAMAADAPAVQARVWAERANLAVVRGDHDAAGSHLAFADAAVVRAGTPPPEQMRVALVRASLAMQQTDFETALEMSAWAAEVAQQIGAAGFRGRALSTQAIAMQALRQPEDALQVLEQAVELIRDDFGPEHAVTDEVLLALGEGYDAAQQPVRAVAILEPLAARLSETRPGSRALVSVLLGLGSAAINSVWVEENPTETTAAPHYAIARDAFERSLTIVTELGDVFRQGSVESALGRLALEQDRHADAEGHYLRAIGFLEQVLPANDPRLEVMGQALAMARAGLAKNR